MTIPVKIAWDTVPDADRYAVYVRPDGAAFSEIETTKTEVVVNIPERHRTLIYVTSRQGQTESINSEEMHIYTARW